MHFSSGRLGRSSLGIGIAVYAVGTAFAATVTAHAVWRVGTAVVEQLAPAAETPPRNSATTVASAARAVVAAPVIRQQSVGREAAMTPLADRWDGRWGGENARPQPRVWGAAASQFGTSSRNLSRSPFGDRLFDADDEDDRPVGTYRTVCVRLCDGFYFPVSFAVAADRLKHDRGVCESRCGAQGRLFVHPNPGGSFDDLRDLSGRPYSQLRTAYLYRTEYVPSCTCQPQPWDQASLDRHRLYALTAAVRKGNKDAAKELQALETKVKEAAKLAGRPALLSGPASADGLRPGMAAVGAAKAAEIAGREDGALMGLGNNGAPKPKTETGAPLKSRSDRDWVRRAFDR
jgi:Protein of unknown function (DUF2865)